MILICTAHVVENCIRTTTAHGRSAATKEHVCRVCVAAMNRFPDLRDKYNTSILKGIGDGPGNGKRQKVCR